MVTFEKVSYGGWSDCLLISNASIKLVVTTNIGPRIVHFAPAESDKNLLWLDEQTLGKTGGDEWRAYGGHRVWHGPEVKPRTYAPDNTPLEYTWENEVLRLVQPVEDLTGIQKIIEIRMHPDQPQLSLVHKLRNCGQWDIKAAPWALTMMAPGGTAIIPNEPFVPFPDRLLPARPLVLWSYTRMADPRLSWENEYTALRQDPSMTESAKFGVRSTRNWGAYCLNDLAFVKTSELVTDAEYPDFGCNWEVYANDSFLELETLGPLQIIEAAGGEVAHKEEWHLHKLEANADLRETFSRLHQVYGKE